MTTTKLKEAQELSADISRLENLLKSFPSFYILGNGQDKNNPYEICEVDDSMTYTAIKFALQARLDTLNAKFAEL